MSAFFKRYLLRKFEGSNKSFYEICSCYITVLFNNKGQLLYYNVGVYALVESQEEYSLIWKAKLLTIQTKVNGKKMTKKVKNEKTMDYCDTITHQMTSYIINLTL